MINLIEGVKLIDYNPDLLKPRIYLNSGTFSSQKLEVLNKYDKEAFIPLESWVEADPQSLSILIDREYRNLENTSNKVGILHLPDSILEPLEEVGVAFARNSEDCYLVSQESTYQEAITRITEYIKSFSPSNRSLIFNTISTNPPGLHTVTYDPARELYIGLHLDSWDKEPFEKRHLSSNRICINVGLEDRYFLFINLTLLDMYNLLRLEDKVVFVEGDHLERRSLRELPIEKIQPNEIRKSFFQIYPSYPVTKVRVSPGEAYIAPTENIIHDGCTLGKSFFDVTLTIRGHIGLPR